LIDILLTTYNGEKYLSQQLDSIFNQTNSDFRILIRDDFSSDHTLKVIHKYIELYSEKIILITDNLGNLGSSKSFMQLLSHSKAPYIMFCDQDDIWLSNKIELSISELYGMEELYGKASPLLVFTDLKVVDYDLHSINDSFWSYQKLIPELSKNWKKLLAQNVITGCTILMNQEAKEISLPFQLPYMIHDQWIGINVARYGKIDFFDEPTLLYRQHEANVAGAHQYSLKYVWHKIKNLSLPIQKIYFSSQYFKVSLIQLLYYKLTINLTRILRKS
jgi:glycosyltransferase involved in cell wall biosynthesis